MTQDEAERLLSTALTEIWRATNPGAPPGPLRCDPEWMAEMVRLSGVTIAATEETP